MISIETIFAAIEAAYRRTEEVFRSLRVEPVEGEELVAQAMKLFQPLYLDRDSESSLEAYFRYLVHDVAEISDVPFNFLLREDKRADEIVSAFLEAQRLITGQEQKLCEISEAELLDGTEATLEQMGASTVCVIRDCWDTLMTESESTAWRSSVELFRLTPRIVKILRVPQKAIENRFRPEEHLYYRVFRNRLLTRPITSEDIYHSLLDVLEQRTYQFSPEFLTELRLYLDTVYPKADLREEAFVADMVERIVREYYRTDRGGSMVLDADCVPYYIRPGTETPPFAPVAPDEPPMETTVPPAEEDENKSAQPVAPAESPAEATAPLAEDTEDKAAPVYDDPMDDYIKNADGVLPEVKNILIISLSTLPGGAKKELRESTYSYQDGANPPKIGKYHQQQEPFVMQLRDSLKDCGEIIMLTTKETRQVVEITADGITSHRSAMGYFIDSALAETGGVLFKSIEVEQDNPIEAVSTVVDHLRTVYADQKTKPQIHLGTNGGLRGTQLILEAILSLLTADGITVNPDHVWSTMYNPETKESVMFNSAAEFKIFDFVSGINEFLNYGRSDSLEKFVETNNDLREDTASELLACIKDIAAGIQFCSIASFEKGLDRLSAFFRLKGSSSNPYIEIFRDNIRHEYEPLIAPGREVLDEIEWCMKKGFYQQAFTLVEGALPREYVDKGIIRLDPTAIKQGKRVKRFKDEDSQTFLFNSILMSDTDTIVSGTTSKTITRIVEGKRNQPPASFKLQFSQHSSVRSLSQAFKEILPKHRAVKDDRNSLNHISTIKPGKSPEEYLKTLTDFTDCLRAFYQEWDSEYRASLIEIQGTTPPRNNTNTKPISSNSPQQKAKKKGSPEDTVLLVSLQGIFPPALSASEATLASLPSLLSSNVEDGSSNPEIISAVKQLKQLRKECKIMASMAANLTQMESRKKEIQLPLKVIALRQAIESNTTAMKPGTITRGIIKEYIGKSGDVIYSNLTAWLADQAVKGSKDSKDAVYALFKA